MADSNGNTAVKVEPMVAEDDVAAQGTTDTAVKVEKDVAVKVEEKDVAANGTTKNVKTELTSLDEKIIRQIEYYFGDINLGRDKFLQEQVKLDDGWVPLEIMIKFNRLASLSTDSEAIVNSLEKSSNDLMEISEDRKKIRRSPNVPLPIQNEEHRKEVLSRSVYAKGFPATGLTMDDALTWFSKYGKPESVQLRNYKDKATNTWMFKGSVYAVFTSLDDAKSFIERASVKYDDVEIARQWLSVHVEDKRVKYAEKRTNSKQERKKPEVAEEPKETGLTKGAMLHLTGFSGDIGREEIKRDLQALGGNVLFVDFNKGDTEGWVRLDKKGSAQELLDKMTDGKCEVDGVTVDVTVLDGEVEDAYLAKSLEAMKRRRANNRGGGRGRGRGGGRGGGRGRGNFRGRGGYRGEKRKGSPTRGERASKRQAV